MMSLHDRLSPPISGILPGHDDEETRMPSRDKIEIQAIWHEPPSLFSSGLMKWVAVAAGPTGPIHVRESTAFPIDDSYVDGDASGHYPYVRIVRDEMDEAERQTVQWMLDEFVKLLEHDGWIRAGQGSDWYNLRFMRPI
jgi:hypothetical protein